MRLPGAAASLGAAVAALALVAVPLTLMTGDYSLSGYGMAVAVVATFAAVGVAVARHQARNPIGWIMLTIAVLGAVLTDAGLYAVLDYRMRGGTLPLGAVAVLLKGTLLFALSSLTALVVILFPEGRTPSPRWRWAIRTYLACCAVNFLAGSTVQAINLAHAPIQVDLTGNAVVAAPAGGVVQAVSYLADEATGLVLLVSAIVFAGYQAVAFLRSAGERRQQLKWLMIGGVLVIISFPVLNSGLANSPSTAGHVVTFAGGLAAVALPVGIGVGITKYRLYEIDRVISRTVAYTIVTGLLLVAYVGSVTVTSLVPGTTSPVVVAASTLVVAGLFNPLRRRVQRLVDRRFNRARYDTEQMVATFAARLSSLADLDTLQRDVVDAARRAFEPAHVCLWLTAASLPRTAAESSERHDGHRA